MVCRSSVSACSPYIPDASEPITLFSQRVWCGAQHFQRHLWEFVAFFGLNRSTSGLTTTFGYSPLGIASNSSYLSVLNSYPRYSVSSAGFLPPRSYVLIYLPFLPRFSTSPAHASCGDVKLHTLCVNTTVSTAVSFNHSAISCLHLLYAVPLNLLVHAITFHFSTSSFRTFVEGGAADFNKILCFLILFFLIKIKVIYNINISINVVLVHSPRCRENRLKSLEILPEGVCYSCVSVLCYLAFLHKSLLQSFA